MKEKVLSVCVTLAACTVWTQLHYILRILIHVQKHLLILFI